LIRLIGGQPAILPGAVDRIVEPEKFPRIYFRSAFFQPEADMASGSFSYFVLEPGSSNLGLRTKSSG
jgi:hypothetical protein